MASELIQSPQKEVHDVHPSLANLQGAIGAAKVGLSVATQPQDYKVKRVETATNLKSVDLRPFKDTGERNLLILVDNIVLFDDKSLTQTAENIQLEKNAIVSGTYLYDNNNVVHLGNPYNVYCRGNDVEPQDLTHSQYNQNTQETEDHKQSDDFVMVETDDSDHDNKQNKASEHQKTSTMHIVDEEEPQYPDADLPNTYSIQNNASDNVAIREAQESSHQLDVEPDTLFHQASISASIPDIDGGDYPADVIVALEENRPSFIQTLPPKTSATFEAAALVDTAHGLDFETLNEEQEASVPLNADDNDDEPEPELQYKQQNMNNMNNNLTNTDNTNYYNVVRQRTHSVIEYKYFMNNFLVRHVILSVTLLLCSILIMPEWFRSMEYDTFKHSYGICAFGIFVIFLGAIGSIFGGMLEVLKVNIPYKGIFIYIIMSLYIVGGFFYFVGACAVAHSYNKLLGSGYAAIGGVWWSEMFYVAIISIITGIDMKQLLNRWDLRVTLFLSLLVFVGLISSVCSMISGSKLYEMSSLTALGVMYLFDWLLALTFLIMRLLTVLTTVKTSDNMELGVMIALLIVWICTGFTYFAIAADQVLSESASYYVGMGLLQIFTAIFVTFDVSFCHHVMPRLSVKKPVV